MNILLEKLTITPLAKRGNSYEPLPDIPVMFNPESYSVSKSVKWETPSGGSGSNSPQSQSRLNAPVIAFGGGECRQLSLELFFDVTGPLERYGRRIVIADVREETNKLVELTRIQRDEDQPRACRISWGKAPTHSDFPFTGVITSLNQRFTQFSRSGRPLRANVTISLKEFLDPDLDRRQTDPELTTHIVREGETLSQIAAQMYRDPQHWRTIAVANSLDDPRHLAVGHTLLIPKLR